MPQPKQYVDSLRLPVGHYLPLCWRYDDRDHWVKWNRETLIADLAVMVKLKYNGHDAFEWGNSVNIMHQTLRALSRRTETLMLLPVLVDTLSTYGGTDKIRWGY